MVYPACVAFLAANEPPFSGEHRRAKRGVRVRCNGMLGCGDMDARIEPAGAPRAVSLASKAPGTRGAPGA
jgi:hypothetical protein